MDERPDLSRLYAEVQAALASKDLRRAGELLKQILVYDENYKDASRLLAQVVAQQRRRWNRDARLWGVVATATVIGGIALLYAPIQEAVSRRRSVAILGTSSPALVATRQQATLAARAWIPASPSPEMTGTQITGAAPTATRASEPTRIPLVWHRLYLGELVERDAVTAIVLDPRDPEVLYAGLANAGIYKSIDGGISWQPSFQSLGHAGIDSMVVSPDEPDRLYVGVKAGGLCQSTDGGRTWDCPVRIGGAGAPSLVVMDPQDSLHLYLTAGKRMYETIDGGGSWAEVGSETDSGFHFFDLAFDPKESLRLYASFATYSPETWGTYASDDGGRTWALLAVAQWSGPSSTHIVTGPDGVLAYHYLEGRLLNSADGGETWVLYARTPVKAVYDFAVSPHDPRTIYLAGHGVWVSKDAGLSWIERSNGLGTGIVHLFLHPTDPSMMYAEAFATGYGPCRLFRSKDRGQTWIRLVSPSCNLAVDAGGEVLYQGRQRSRDRGLDWEVPTLPGEGPGFYPAAHPQLRGRVFLLIVKDGTIARSVDYGDSWRIIGSSVWGDALFCGGEERMYAMGHRAGHRSDDGGETWVECGGTDSFSSPQSASQLIVWAGDTDSLLQATRGLGVLRSDDNCQSWRPANSGLGSQQVNTLASDPRSPEVVYAGTDGGAYVSFDGGESWGEINDGLLGATVVYSVVVDPEGNVYAATPYGVFKLEGK